jgi:hypothetical protein
MLSVRIVQSGGHEIVLQSDAHNECPFLCLVSIERKHKELGCMLYVVWAEYQNCYLRDINVVLRRFKRT